MAEPMSSFARVDRILSRRNGNIGNYPGSTLEVELIRGELTQTGGNERLWIVFLKSNLRIHRSGILRVKFQFADKGSVASGAKLLQLGTFHQEPGRDLPAFDAEYEEAFSADALLGNSREDDGGLKTENPKEDRSRIRKHRAPEEDISYVKVAPDVAWATITTEFKGGVAVILRCQSCSMTISVRFDEQSPLSQEIFRAEQHRQATKPFSINIDDSSSSSSHTALGWAAGSGWRTGLKTLLDATDKKFLNDVDSNGRSALSWAMGNGQIETGGLLIEKVDINKSDAHGRTALSWAAEGGYEQAVDKLLAAGAERTLDMDRRSPLWWAAASGSKATIDVLLRAEKDGFLNLKTRDESGVTPLDKAASGGHAGAIRALVDAIIKNDAEEELTHPSTFVPDYLLKAVKEGWNALVKVLVDVNASVDPAKEYRIPFCLAVQYGRKDSVEVLLSAGVKPDSEDDNGHSALCLAIKYNQEAIVEILSHLGIDPRKRDAFRDTPWDLAEKAENRSFLIILAAAAKEGKLAESENGYTHPNIDDKFMATVFSFDTKQNGNETFVATPISVEKLLKAPNVSLIKEQQTFHWIHLPANNMRWVELLIVRLNNPKRAYQILKPERWVRRQHCGASKQPHARFMLPMCQAFPSDPIVSTSSRRSRDLADETTSPCSDLVLFMPFLHWDINGSRLQRQLGSNDVPTINPKTGKATTHPYSPGTIPVRDLITQYYNNDDHSLHMRRSLDQYYYHTLLDTEDRDESQVITRYQKSQDSFSRAITMVDQLWLWVLKGSKGKPDMVITCFPPVEKFDSGLKENYLDPYDDTDVLECIKKHLRTEPSSVQSAHDLAGVIVAVCSRNYLDPATTLALNGRNTRVQFSDVYETAIGNLMQSEATSFKDFKELPTTKVADIVKEIASLWEIKDVIDELNIMAVLFQDQKRVFKDLDALVWAIYGQHLRLESNKTTEREQNATEIEDAGMDREPEVYTHEFLYDMVARAREMEREEQLESKRGSEFHGVHPVANTASVWRLRDEGRTPSLPIEWVNTSIDDINGMMDRANTVQKALNTLVDLKYKHNNVIDSQKSLEMTTQTAVITKHIENSGAESLKLAKSTATLTTSIEDSTRETKKSAGETEKLTKEIIGFATKADKEGRTVMVFTVVTIIFLPLSFLATMFQLPILQYERKDDMLDLGYVCRYMLSISFSLSAVLIWVAFQADFVERIFNGIFGSIFKREQAGNKQNENPASSSSSTSNGMKPPEGPDAV